MAANYVRNPSLATLSLRLLLITLSWLVPLYGGGVAQSAAQNPQADQSANQDARIVEEIKRLYRYRQDSMVRRDFDAFSRLYADDLLVTNPSNRVLNKAQVLELMRGDVVSYSSFDRQFDEVRVYGEMVVVVGSETASYTPDAKSPYAGKTIQRRFTEMWMRRDGKWQVVVRHAGGNIMMSQ